MAVTTAAVVGAGASLGSGIMGSRSSKKAAKQQAQMFERQAAQNKAFLQGRDSEVQGLLANLSRTGGAYANQGGDVRARSMAQLLGLFGGPAYQGQTFRSTRPDYARIAQRDQDMAARRQHRAALQHELQSHADANTASRGAHNRIHGARIATLQRQLSDVDAMGDGYSDVADITEEYAVNAPAGGGLFDDVLAAHDKYFKELNEFSSEDFSNRELDLYRQLARPEENRQGLRLQDRLFAQGRLGTTGGAEEQGQYQQALNQADTGRVLQAIQGGRNEQGRLFNLAFSPEYQNYMGTMQDLYSQYYGDENAAADRNAAFQTGVLGQRIDQFNNYTNAYLNQQNQADQNQAQAMQNQAAASQGLWQGIGQFGGALAQGAMANPGFGSRGGGGGGGAPWAGIPYRTGVTSQQTQPWYRRMFS